MLTLGRAYCDATLSGCVGNGIYFDYAENGNFNPDNMSMTTAEYRCYLPEGDLAMPMTIPAMSVRNGLNWDISGNAYRNHHPNYGWAKGQ